MKTFFLQIVLTNVMKLHFKKIQNDDFSYTDFMIMDPVCVYQEIEDNLEFYRAQSEFFARYVFKSTKHLFSKGKLSEDPKFNSGNSLCRIWYSNNCKTINHVMSLFCKIQKGEALQN